jgi:hypothetical protein
MAAQWMAKRTLANHAKTRIPNRKLRALLRLLFRNLKTPEGT